MIQVIGLMIGLYILMQAAAVASRSGPRAESSIARVLAALTMAGAVYGIYMLLSQGAEITKGLSR